MHCKITYHYSHYRTKWS